MRIAIIYNPVAGAGRAAAQAAEVSGTLEGADHEIRMIETQPAPPARWLVPALEGQEAMVVVGGDGAVRLCAPAAVATGIGLIHHPLGTENLFSREFPAGRTLTALRETFEQPAVERIDIGRANSHWFTLMASVGLDAQVVYELAARRRGAISHLSYTMPIVHTLRKWTAPPLTVRVDGATVIDGERGIVVVANIGQYALRIDPAHGADPEDGQLDVVFLPVRGALSMMSWALACRRRRQAKRKGYRFARGREIVIERPEGAHFQIDGDPPPDDPGGPITIACHAGVLPVITGRVR